MEPAASPRLAAAAAIPRRRTQIDDLLTDEAKSADRSATQQGEADEQHHCGLNCRHESAGEGEATGDDGRRQARPTPIDPAADHRCRQNPCKRTNCVGDRGRSARDAKIGSDRIEENGDARRLAGQGHERAEGAGAQYDPAIMESRSSGAHRPHVINPPGASLPPADRSQIPRSNARARTR